MIPALLLLGAAAALSLDDGVPSPLRHLLLVPAASAALARGTTGGAAAGVLAGLLQAPLVFPLIEAQGLSARALDAGVGMVLPLALGLVLGAMADELRGRASTLHALLAIQQGLGDTAAVAVEEQLGRVAEDVRRALGVSSAAVVLLEEDQAAAVASAPPGQRYHPRSAAGWVARRGEGIAFADLDTDARFGVLCGMADRPRRGLVLPLRAGAHVLGALALESCGDLRRGARAAAEEIAMHLALALENARLGMLQRRFTEELESKVAAATRRLRELDEAKSEFVSVVSHELRTPLTALVGFAELLLTREVPRERARQWLGHVHGEAQRLARIVGDLLDVARIESGAALDLARERLDVGAVVERNVDLFAAAHPRHRFVLEVCERAVVPADPDAIDRVVKNLLSNAVKYSPRGGQVAITVTAVSACRPMLAVVVEDEGVGIPAEVLPRIFDRYVRVADPATTGVRGLGLGLCLVRALVEAHGGRVSVMSNPGRGSRFSVLLPA